MDWNNILNALSGASEKSGFMYPESKGGGINWDRMGTTLGMLASSMAPQGTWQHGVGNVGQQIGQSTIAAKAGEKLGQQQSGLFDVIQKLGGMTAPSMQGVTGATMGENGEYKITGTLPTGQTPTTAPKTAPAPTTTVPSGAVTETPTTDIQQAIANLMGSKLANFQSSPAGLSMTDLAGLSPEQIGSLLSQQLAGRQMNLETAKAAYEMTKPREGKVVEGEQFYHVVDPVSGKSIKTSIPIYHKPVSATGEELAWTKPTEVKGWDKDGKPISIMTTYGNYNNVVRTIEQQGGRVGEAPGQVREVQNKLSAAEVTANSPKAKKDEKRTACSIYNTLAPNENIDAYLFKDRIGPGYKSEKVRLPKTKDGRQITIGDVRQRAIDTGRTIEEVVENLMKLSGE